jgi:carboxylesterase
LETQLDFAEAATPFSFKNGSTVGILILHGFTGNPWRVRYWGERFSLAGFDVECPLLTGHGSTWQDFGQCRWQDWRNDAEQALVKIKERCTNIFVGGLSMGGALALDIAARHPELKGILVVNPALYVAKGWLLALTVPWLKYFVKSIKAGKSDIKDQSVVMPAYKRTPLEAVHQLLKLTREVRGELERVMQPTLIMVSRSDHVVPARSPKLVHDRIASERKEWVWLENSYHVATRDFDKDLIADRSITFVRELIQEVQA